MYLARGIPLAGIILLSACSSGAPRENPRDSLEVTEAATRTADSVLLIPNSAISPSTRENTNSPAAIHSEVKGVSAGRSIYFSDNDAALSDESRTVIHQHAAYLKQNPKRFIVLRAFLDGLGSRTFSLAIVQKRLDIVVQTLREQGVAKSRIRQVMVGQRGNKMVCATPPCRNGGHRIELIYK